MSEAISYFLGVDGGGTKTTAVLVSQTTQLESTKNSGLQCLLGESVVEGSNPLSVGWETAFNHITKAVSLAKQSADWNDKSRQIQKAVFAIAGTANPTAKQYFTNWVQSQGFANQVVVVSDTAPLLANVVQGESAIGVIAGTGSAVLVQDHAGNTTTVGGWGYLLDDAGSGFSIGRRAIREVVRSFDRNEENVMTSALFEALSIDEISELKHAIYGAKNPRHMIASVAKSIINLANQQDQAAMRLLQVEASLLANEISIAWDRLNRQPDSARQGFTLYLGGSLLQRSVTYRNQLSTAVKQLGLPLKTMKLAPEGACGCALLAGKLTNQIIT